MRAARRGDQRLHAEINELICYSACLLIAKALRGLPQQITLIRDPHCIRGSHPYLSAYEGRPSGSPSPDTPPFGQISLS
jgi:hypothetical protein